MTYTAINKWLYNHHDAVIEFKGKLIATGPTGWLMKTLLVSGYCSPYQMILSFGRHRQYWQNHQKRQMATGMYSPRRAFDSLTTLLLPSIVDLIHEIALAITMHPGAASIDTKRFSNVLLVYFESGIYHKK